MSYRSSPTQIITARRLRVAHALLPVAIKLFAGLLVLVLLISRAGAG